MNLLVRVFAALIVLSSTSIAQTTTMSDIGTELGNNAAQARANLALPSMINVREMGGYADAMAGEAQIFAKTTHVGLASLQFVDVTLTTATTGLTTVASPGWVLPDISAAPSGISTYFVDIPNAGVGGTTVHCTGSGTSFNPLTGAITVSSCTNNFAAGTGTYTIGIYMAAAGNQAPKQAARYGIISVTNVTDAVTGKVYGSQIVLDKAMLPHTGSLGNAAINGVRVCVETAANGVGGWCGIVTNSAALDGETMIVTGTDGYPIAYPNPSATLTAKVSWGRFLFRTNDATACSGGGSATAGRNLEVPEAGSVLYNIGGVTPTPTNTLRAPFEGVIASRSDAFAVTLASSVSTAVPASGAGAVDAIPIAGCDDYPAIKKAVDVIYRTPPSQEKPVSIYLPGDAFLATSYADSTAAMQYLQLVTMCGEGTVWWPVTNGQIMNHGATSCNQPRSITSFPDTKDIIPAIHLKHLTSLSAGSTATLVLTGNSPAVPGSNGGNFISGRLDRICAAFQQAYPDLVWRCVDRAVGGSQSASLDPNGYSNGRPNNYGSLRDDYSDYSVSWLTGWIEPLNPDVIIVGFADQENTTESISYIYGVQQTTQSTGWASTTGWNPDMIFMPLPWQPTGFWSQGTNHAASIQRSYAKACVTKLANGGCWGLIDENRMLTIAVDGYDPETQPMRWAQGLPPRDGQNITSFPWQDRIMRNGMSIPVLTLWTNASPSGAGLITAAGGEIDYTVGAAANTVPQDIQLTPKTSASAASGQAVLTFGTYTYTLSVGELATATGIPANTYIQSINNGAGTVTLTNNLTSAIGSVSTITFKPQGPNTGYPGNILRIGYDTGTSNVTYRYDTVYFQVAAADCSATSATATVTCSTPEVGNWHRGLQMALPGAGTDQCPNPGGGTTCFIGTIDTVSITTAGVETITLKAGKTAANSMMSSVASVTTTVSNVQPYVFRTSIPLTNSGYGVENLGSLTTGCALTAGTKIQISHLIEYRGSRLGFAYCQTSSPGLAWLFNRFVERWDSPFNFTVDSPNHLNGGSNLIMYGQGGSLTNFSLNEATRGLGTALSTDFNKPNARPLARLAPDIYGWCSSMPAGDPGFSTWAGQCSAHYGHNGGNVIDDALLSMLRLR